MIFRTILQAIEGLDDLVNLEELWLGKNKISKFEVCRSLGMPKNDNESLINTDGKLVTRTSLH